MKHKWRATFIAIFVAMLILTAVIVGAEDTSVPKAASLKLPKGNGTWAIQIHRTGGLTGSPMDMTLLSDGKVLCNPPSPRCAAGLNSSDLKKWSDLVFSAPVPKSQAFISGTCSDCYFTEITVRRRDSKGKEQTLFAYWDDAASGTPMELVKIVQAAVSLK